MGREIGSLHITPRGHKGNEMKIIEVYCQEEKFNPRLNCTVSGAWMVRYANGIEVPICRDYEASDSKEALSILNQEVTA
jgi:hypothetical protein